MCSDTILTFGTSRRTGFQPGSIAEVCPKTRYKPVLAQMAEESRLSKRRLGDRGFSLVELMVVMVIIGMLASLVVFRTRSYLIASKQNAAKAEIARIVQALDTFYAIESRYPTNDEGLEILAARTESMTDGILNKVPVDPWKQAYQYNNPGRSGPYEVICLGADGREGGDGPNRDINNDELDQS
jgi:general secretion pathway protein G